jgi:hypothetical protein
MGGSDLCAFGRMGADATYSQIGIELDVFYRGIGLTDQTVSDPSVVVFFLYRRGLASLSTVSMSITTPCVRWMWVMRCFSLDNVGTLASSFAGFVWQTKQLVI